MFDSPFSPQQGSRCCREGHAVKTGGGAGLVLHPCLASAGLHLSLQEKHSRKWLAHLHSLCSLLCGWHWIQGTGLEGQHLGDTASVPANSDKQSRCLGRRNLLLGGDKKLKPNQWKKTPILRAFITKILVQ